MSLPRCVLALDRGVAARVQRTFPQTGELLEALLDRVRDRRDRDARALVAVQRLGFSLFLDLGLFDGHGPPSVPGEPGRDRRRSARSGPRRSARVGS